MGANLKVNDVEDRVKTALEPYKMMQLFASWERHREEWKLIYSIYGITIEEHFCIHTRLVFLFNENKTELITNTFLVLIDTQCNYQPIEIGTHLDINIINAIKSVSEIGSISDLSNFFMSGTDGFNAEIKRQDIKNFIFDLKFIPNKKSVNCFDQKFYFTITDQLGEWNFSLEMDSEMSAWHVSVNGTSTNVDNLTEDVYKQIIDNKYK